MDISDDVSKAKADLADAKVQLTALEAFWAAHKAAAIAVAVAILFAGFTLGRLSAHL